MLPEGGRRTAQITATEPERTRIFTWKDDSCDIQFEMLHERTKNRKGRVSTRNWCHVRRARRAGNHQRQAFRFPEEASTATISGCKSSVREITGNKSARAQTIATVSRKTRARGFRRDTSQRNRQSHSAASVMISHNKLRIVSVIALQSRMPPGQHANAALGRTKINRCKVYNDGCRHAIGAASGVERVYGSDRSGRSPLLVAHLGQEKSHGRRVVQDAGRPSLVCRGER